MPFSASADSSRAQLSYIVESTVGTTPATPAMQKLRMTGESLNGSRTTASSTEIRADRNTSDLITTAETSSGNINFELSCHTYDDFLAAALQGAWTANVLKNGTTRSSFTVLKQFVDVNKSYTFTGCEIGSMNLSMQQGGMVTGDFGMIARGNAATAPTGATFLAASTTPVYNLTNHMTGLSIDGSQYADGIQTLSMALNNNPREQRQIGSKNLAGVGMGTLGLTGSLTAYFGSATAINTAFDNDTPVALTWTLTNSGGSYTFLLPSVKFSSRTVVAGGINQDVVLNLNWTAIYNSTEDCMIKVTRA